MDAKKRLYIGDFLAEGSSKAVFKVGASIRSDGDYNDKVKNKNHVPKKPITLTQNILEKIYVEVPPEIDSNDIAVSRIAFTGYIDYYNNINNLNFHLFFGRSGYAPKIYGIVTSVEPNPKAANPIKALGFSRVPGYPAPLSGLNKNFPPEMFTNNFVTMYIFQEKCIADLKTDIEGIYNNKIKKISTTYPRIIDRALNEMFDNKIVKYLDTSIDTYIDTIGAIELDYKPGNICLQKIDEPDLLAYTPDLASASVSTENKYKWTSFDFDDSFTRGIKQVPEVIKSEFVKYAKLYMKVIFFSTLAFSFRTNIFSSTKTKDINEMATLVMAKKIKEVYHIDYDVILEMISFFVGFNKNHNPGLKVFSSHSIPGHPYMSNTPEYMLRFYAEQYYNIDYGSSGKRLSFKSKQIEDAYNDNTNPVERDAKIICGILGLDFPGNSVVRAMSTASSIPFISNPFASGQMHLLPSPQPNPDELPITSPPNPDELPITLPSQSKRLRRQDSNNEQEGGRKRKNTKSKKNKKHKYRKSHKRSHSRK